MTDAARAMLRTQPKGEISRKSVAVAAGITPALVSYYFPDQSSLFYAAIDPVIRQYTDRFDAITRVEASTVDDLRTLIGLFLDFNRQEAMLLDNYLLIIRDDGNDTRRRAEIERAYADVVDFLERLIVHEGWRGVRARWLTFAIWGMCKSIAQASILPVGPYGADLTGKGLELRQIEDVLAFVRGGVQSCLWM